jgi:hypothetical protein
MLANLGERLVARAARFGPLSWTPCFGTGKVDQEGASNWAENMLAETMPELRRVLYRRCQYPTCPYNSDSIDCLPVHFDCNQ